jgi:hypothetical protein
MGLEGLVFFKGDSKDVLNDLRRFVESHFRGYVYNHLSKRYSEEELTKILVEKLRLTPYRLLCINVCSTHEDLADLADLMENDPVTQRYKRYIEILDRMIKSYDEETDEETVRVRVKATETIIGYEAVFNNVDDVTVYAVTLNLEDHTVKRVELTELLEDC